MPAKEEFEVMHKKAVLAYLHNYPNNGVTE